MDEYKTSNEPDIVPRYPIGGNRLGIKVTNSGSRVVMQRNRLNQNLSHSELSPGLHNLPQANYRESPWIGEDPASIISFQQKQHPIMMEEFHYAGRAVDMILVDTKTAGSTRRSSIYPGKLAQLAYYGALFDWCYFARQGHVHCSVKPGTLVII